ncbi:TolC family protein [Dyadobacter psychrophilus]|uniref:Outer membrane protein TolC n=1 Tax=Dyadobacter psychrophilus TaxID=651661 RepID=A0A1T5ELT4_9BACT|nr:TolC family protein [Dyadobacter psychrophilus]SKB84917.1 Outer membrane protein TolC [Dyadobacter psychrophilus]
MNEHCLLNERHLRERRWRDRLRWKLLFAALLFSFSNPLSAQDRILDAYISQGLKNNQGLRQQDFLLQKSLYALKEAKSYFLPEVNFNTSYLDSRGGRKISIPIGDLLNPVYSSLNQLTNSTAFPQVENVNQTFNPNNYYDAKFRTSLPLYNPEIAVNTKIRKEQINFQQADYDVYKRELVKEIKLGYYAYLQSEEAIRILESAVNLARENLRFNRVLVSNDKAIRTVVSRSENELIGLEARLEEAKYQSKSAAAYFNFLLNSPLDTKIETGETLQSEPTAGANAFSKREELLKLESLAKINTLSGQLAKASSLPKLATFIDLGSQGDFLNFNNDTRYYLFGLTLDWRVFAGNRVQYRTRQALMDSKATGEQLSQVEQQLELQSQTASNKLNAAIRIFQASKSQTALSQQYYQDQQKLYREGQLLYIELLDAQNRLVSDQLQQSISYMVMQTRSAELERAQASYSFSN